jgi:hypothetical protein
MRVLILHRMMDPRFWRKSVENLELGYLNTFGEIDDIIVWNCVNRIPLPIRKLEFDLVILTSTFLGFLNFPRFSRLEKHYISFLRQLPYKVALPQDEYQNPLIRDSFLSAINVNEIYTIFLNEIDILYPQCVNKETLFSLGFTGYLDQSVVEYSSRKWNSWDRDFLITYRTQPQSFIFGEIGRLKTKIADFFLSIFDESIEPINITYNSKDVFSGNSWYDFLLNSKFVLGSLSGSSFIDFDGRLQNYDLLDFVDIGLYEKIYPEYKLLNSELTAISPRNLEASVFGCCQILIESDYGSIFKPWEHYIPLKRDFSNIEEVKSAMNDDKLVKSMISKCRTMVMEFPGFRLENLLRKIRERALYSIKISDDIYHPKCIVLVMKLYKFVQEVVVFRIIYIRNKLKHTL